MISITRKEAELYHQLAYGTTPREGISNEELENRINTFIFKYKIDDGKTYV